MSWQQVYVTVRTAAIVGGLTIGAGIFWAGLIGGVIRLMLNLDEETALLWIGIPIFVCFIPFGIFVLPKYLRRAGIL